MSRTLHRRVAEAIVARGLWSAGDAVAVAVSGGLDSMALLHLLVETRGVHRADLSVVTVDHGQRSSATKDAAFVAEFATQLGLPIARRALALAPGASEGALRAARYACLEALPVAQVALAHHADDQAETALLGLLAGGGTRAIGGMAWRRGRYVRPLLDVRRSVLHAWAQERGIIWREDPTNVDPAFLRNRVRHELLPLIEDLRAGATASLARGASHAAADDALLDELAAPLGRGPSWSTSALLAAPEPLSRRALAAGLHGTTTAHLDAILAAARRGRGSVALSPWVRVVVASNEVCIVTSEEVDAVEG